MVMACRLLQFLEVVGRGIILRVALVQYGLFSVWSHTKCKKFIVYVVIV